jgi:hypothetical protein
MMKTRYGIRKFGCIASPEYICQVSGCGIDCGDYATLVRHLKREHPNNYLALTKERNRQEGIPLTRPRFREEMLLIGKVGVQAAELTPNGNALGKS